jgi:(1->4)-alpha-D-glucan 1-alpha-D-glucosylmutase
VLEQLFPGELDSLVQELAGLLGRPQVAVREAALALIVAFPVYRTYLRADREPCDADRRVLARATSIAAPTLSEPAAKVLHQLSAMLAGPLEPEVAHLAARLQQLTGPAMAKSVEDTAFYRFPRLLALNEVGGGPATEGIADDEAHRLLAERGKAWPMALLATSTHDTKRGEDARARLLVLAELPGFWAECIERWSRRNAGLRPQALHAVDEASLYQAMVGVWPPALAPGDAHGLAQLRERLAGWQRKSLREAKLRSSWLEPNETYEAAADAFLGAVLDPKRSVAFLVDVAEVVARLGPAGVANGLAQTLIKLTAPGVPDLYQGSEFWDLSLVDPDNRRPVDWVARERQLGSGARLDELLADWRNGALKQRLIQRVLAFRREQAALFADGDYRPLTIEGPAQEHAFAFARTLGDRVAITLVGRRLAGLIDSNLPRLRRAALTDTALLLPDWAAQRSYREIMSGIEPVADTDRVLLSRALARLPVALLVSGA